jgi:acyl carrier protein
MPSEQINEILDIVAQKALIDRSKLTPDVKLADLNVSSLDMVEVIFALEDKFGVQLPFNANTSAGNFQTIGDVIAMVEKQLAEK